MDASEERKARLNQLTQTARPSGVANRALDRHQQRHGETPVQETQTQIGRGETPKRYDDDTDSQQGLGKRDDREHDKQPTNVEDWTNLGYEDEADIDLDVTGVVASMKDEEKALLKADKISKADMVMNDPATFVKMVKQHPDFWFQMTKHLSIKNVSNLQYATKLIKKNDERREKYNDLVAKYNSLKTTHEKATELLKQYEDEGDVANAGRVRDLEDEITVLESQLASKEQELEDNYAAVEEETNKMHATLEDKEERIDALETDKVTLEAQLEKAKKRPDIRGLFARTGTSAAPSNTPAGTPAPSLATTSTDRVDSKWPTPPTFSGDAGSKVEYKIWKAKVKAKIRASYPNDSVARQIEAVHTYTEGLAWQVLVNNQHPEEMDDVGGTTVFTSLEAMWTELDSNFGSQFETETAQMEFTQLMQKENETFSVFYIKFKDVAARAQKSPTTHELWMKLAARFKNRVLGDAHLPFNDFVTKLRQQEQGMDLMNQLHPRKTENGGSGTGTANGTRGGRGSGRGGRGGANGMNNNGSHGGSSDVVRIVPMKYKDLPKTYEDPALRTKLANNDQCFKCQEKGHDSRNENCIMNNMARGKSKFGNVNRETYIAAHPKAPKHLTFNAITTNHTDDCTMQPEHEGPLMLPAPEQPGNAWSHT